MNRYQHRSYHGRTWIICDGRYLGAVSHNIYRSYIYPFLTPLGSNVIEESPPDHPHHQGLMRGEGEVNGNNFWTSMTWGHPATRQQLQDETVSQDVDGVTIVHKIRWKIGDSTVVAGEERQWRWEMWGEGAFVDCTSHFTAEFMPLALGKTKEGGMGMRVTHSLESHMGGVLLSSEKKEGEKQVMDTLADWIVVAGNIHDGPAGIVMMPHAGMEKVPWFCRDYGLHLYSPRRHAPLFLEKGDTYTQRVGFLAFDSGDPLSIGSAAWKKYEKRN